MRQPDIIFQEKWIEPDKALELFGFLKESIPFTQESLVLFGKEKMQPRLLSYHGDSEAVYSYSGRRYEPKPWTAELKRIRDRLESESVYRFNAVLVNYYRDGNDSMGFHADDERELGRYPVVATVSLGAERTFVLKPKDGGEERERVSLKNGSLLIMRGDTQHVWKHGIPKQPSKTDGRISLTFRRVYRTGSFSL